MRSIAHVSLVSLVRLALALVLGSGCAARAPTPNTTASRLATADELAARREVQLQHLHAYAEAGVFPLTDAQLPLSVFRDREGRMCAMASLIARSGHTELVDLAVRTNNAMRLADVRDGAFMDWILASGLTQEEVALIQGALDIDYGSMRFDQPEGVPGTMITAARDLVIHRLRDAEARLRAGTVASLALAHRRIEKPAEAGRAGAPVRAPAGVVSAR